MIYCIQQINILIEINRFQKDSVSVKSHVQFLTKKMKK